MQNKRKLVLYIAMSLDGYIAKPNDDLSFLSLVERENEDYGYATFISTVDTIIIGRRTYEWVTSQFEYPHQDKMTYIISRNKSVQNTPNITYSDNVVELVTALKRENGKTIFCDGGAQLVNALLKHKLIDELILSIIPVLVGEGIRLFENDRPEQNLQLVSSKSYSSGLTQLYYQIL